MAYTQYEPKKHSGLSAAGTELGEGATGGFRNALRGGVGGVLIGAVICGALLGTVGAPLVIGILDNVLGIEALGTVASVAANGGSAALGVVGGLASFFTPIPYMVGGALSLIGGAFGFMGGMDKGASKVRGQELAMRREVAHDAELSVYNNMAQARAMEAQAQIVNAQARMTGADRGVGQAAMMDDYTAPEADYSAGPDFDLDPDKPSMKVDAGSISGAAKLAQTPIAEMAKA
ncbi:MAG: hypothetical protein MRY32_00350 [Rickettsiales bacterium]|nr:hypothetical protein [Rickettsiales bacterium]